MRKYSQKQYSNDYIDTQRPNYQKNFSTTDKLTGHDFLAISSIGWKTEEGSVAELVCGGSTAIPTLKSPPKTEDFLLTSPDFPWINGRLSAKTEDFLLSSPDFPWKEGSFSSKLVSMLCVLMLALIVWCCQMWATTTLGSVKIVAEIWPVVSGLV